MHSKRKGNIGQLATAFCLSKFGFSVFSEQGDISKIDIIAEKHGNLVRFQCKAVKPKDGKLNVPLRKCGPNYRIKYSEDMFDFFSVFDLDSKELYLLPSKILRDCDNTFSLRVAPPKNGQTKSIHLAKNYLAERLLRDYTDNIRPQQCEDDDIVQTAT